MNLPRVLAVVSLLALPLFAMTGCSSIQYYGQSVVGHSRLMLAREPIDELILTSDPTLAAQLRLAQELRRYAVDQLALPDNKSYSNYVDLQRDYPVWTVVAAQEFSVEPETWCYPVIGCAAYRGYFSAEAAQRYAAKLSSKNLETTVGGAVAYSTLGWFADPLLPSMMRDGVAELAETLFHELAHQVLYVNGNSAFNEAFASVVGEQGALSWLQQHRPNMVGDYRQRLQARADFYNLLRELKIQLKMLYQSNVSNTVKRRRKQELMVLLRDDYEQLKQTRWQGNSRYDGWFSRPVNNARLAAFSTYRELMPQLELLLEQCEGDFAEYFNLLKSIPKKRLAEALPNQC